MNEDVHPDDRVILTCWKDVARYMGKGVRTVQRWEREFGLPVRRPNGAGDHKAAIVANPRDLDRWLETRWLLRVKASKARPQPGPVHMADALETSRTLRKAHSNLVHEVSAALHALVQSCDRLSRRDESAE